MVENFVSMSDEERLNWASGVLEEIRSIHALALDLQGWKIVHQDQDYKWPILASETAFYCPDWCENLDRP